MEKEILQKLKKWVDQELNRNEELIYAKEKSLDKLKYSIMNMNCLKFKHARTCNNRMFQEVQEMIYKKTQGTKQLRDKVANGKTSRVLGRNLGRQPQNPTTKMV